MAPAATHGTVDGSANARLRFALLNDWQRDWPLVDRPYAAIAATSGGTEQQVIATYRELLAEGAISRIGGIWGAGAGGAALLCAFAVPEERLEAVAALVSAHPGVNHNYEREHHFNLWFVVTGRDSVAVAMAVDALELQTGCRALRLRMRRAYRIDLGFDLKRELAARGPVARREVEPVQAADAPLAALLEDGLPLTERPFEAWAQRLGDQPGSDARQLRETLQRWLQQGTLRRLGVIVRHHEAGFGHNAMTVFDVPDALVDHCGDLLAVQPGVTLAYQRERAEDWPYNLYCMVHGRDRGAVHAAIAAAIQGSGLATHPQAVLFSRRRFKQAGARYFRPPLPADCRMQEAT
ncbi:MAG: Lrp/AsnC family transcriptional regulator [Rhizobacter sp.]|nr:Lrp/AsnC family transcriptional regulator [Rhizobacter sp.]